MTAEFERLRRKPALRGGMTFAAFIARDEADRAVLHATIRCRFGVGAA
jgi:hypothetical protein